VNPVLVPTIDDQQEIIGFEVVQPDSFEAQMLQYSQTYGNL
jgi:dipeptidyl-peptidase-3